MESGLTALELAENGLGPDGAEALVPALATLQRLGLEHNALGADGASRPASSGAFPVTECSVYMCLIN